MTRGKFITLEGGEGAGKSTQIRRLSEWLRSAGQTDVVMTREPGGSAGAEAIRELLVNGEVDRWDGVTEVLLHFAARRDHVMKTIEPALARGAWVICDRFADSTRAYQGIVQGAGLDVVEAAYALAVGDLEPDLTLILDLPVYVGLARANERGGSDRYERMGREFHKALRDAFLKVGADYPERCVVVDATGDEDAVEQAIRAAVSKKWP